MNVLLHPIVERISTLSGKKQKEITIETGKGCNRKQNKLLY